MFKDSLSHVIKTLSQRNESKRIQWLRIKILEGKKNECLLINLIPEKTEPNVSLLFFVVFCLHPPCLFLSQ